MYIPNIYIYITLYSYITLYIYVYTDNVNESWTEDFFWGWGCSVSLWTPPQSLALNPTHLDSFGCTWPRLVSTGVTHMLLLLFRLLLWPRLLSCRLLMLFLLVPLLPLPVLLLHLLLLRLMPLPLLLCNWSIRAFTMYPSKWNESLNSRL